MILPKNARNNTKTNMVVLRSFWRKNERSKYRVYALAPFLLYCMFVRSSMIDSKIRIQLSEKPIPDPKKNKTKTRAFINQKQAIKIQDPCQSNPKKCK